MSDGVVNFLKSITDNQYLIVLFVALFPLIELKGAIPIGVRLGLKLTESSLFAYLGSTIVIFPIFFLLIPVFKLLKKIKFIKRLIEKIETAFKVRAEKVAKRSNGRAEDVKRKMLIRGLFIFVAVPLPFTGVWTGTAIAVFLDMKFKDALLPLAVGNLIAGVLITLLTWVFGKYVDIIIWCVFALAVVMLVATIIKICLIKPETVATDDEEK